MASGRSVLLNNFYVLIATHPTAVALIGQPGFIAAQENVAVGKHVTVTALAQRHKRRCKDCTLMPESTPKDVRIDFCDCAKYWWNKALPRRHLSAARPLR